MKLKHREQNRPDLVAGSLPQLSGLIHDMPDIRSSLENYGRRCDFGLSMTFRLIDSGAPAELRSSKVDDCID